MNMRLLLVLLCLAHTALGQGVDINDTARYLAGLPVRADSPLVPLTRGAEWQQHASILDTAWTRLARRQLSPISDWTGRFVPRSANVFYFFSGPDFLYADAFFPDATTYILCAREEIGPPPDALALPPGALTSMETTLNSVLNFSFFITKDMKVDLRQPELQGVLPVLYVFLARSGKTISEVSFVGLARDGSLRPGGGNGLAPGVRIVFSGGGGGAQTLYYFTSDLSDAGLKAHDGVLQFCRQLGHGNSFLKSASYLMHEGGFDTVRTFLLDQSDAILQDDSGIPVSRFDPAKWQVRLFGSYPGPIEIFAKHFQPGLRTAYERSNPPPLEFGMGYRFNPSQSSVIVARRR